eukprot:13748614-Alexandrium_andersonii.AAC.1
MADFGLGWIAAPVGPMLLSECMLDLVPCGDLENNLQRGIIVSLPEGHSIAASRAQPAKCGLANRLP